MILINGQPEDRIHVQDRGLQYGDGVFETIAYRQGQAEFLNAHLRRLHDGCQRLKIPLESDTLDSELMPFIEALTDDCVIKIIITRGSGGRGYNIQHTGPSSRIISSHKLPDFPAERSQGIRARLCEQRLAVNPTLAGIKHLNRLEQILARAEWQDTDIAEGLMFDTQDTLREGTMSNVFLVRDGCLLTPDLTSSGVAGIMRQQLVNLAENSAIPVDYQSLNRQDLLEADECFVCNSLIGIWPVTEIIGVRDDLPYGALTQTLQRDLESMEK